jgi:hypothetical protein
MFEWKLFYRDENGRDARSTHSSRGTTIVQALHLARRCHIDKIEGPNGERIDNERFEREPDRAAQLLFQLAAHS